MRMSVCTLLPPLKMSVNCTKQIYLPPNCSLQNLIRCTSIPLDKTPRPNTLQAALQYCDKDAFPTITLPIPTNSQLKLLKTYLRSTMTNGRLSALAVIKVHRSMVKDLNFDQLVLMFTNKRWVAVHDCHVCQCACCN